MVTTVVGGGVSENIIRNGNLYAIMYDKIVDFDNALNNKLSALYSVGLLRDFENKFGSDELKKVILTKLKCIDDFDDCLVVTDFTKFNETGTGAWNLQTDDTLEWQKSKDSLKAIITLGSSDVSRSGWMYKVLGVNATKLFVSCLINVGKKIAMIDACDDESNNRENPPNFYSCEIYVDTSSGGLRILKNVNGSSSVLASEGVNIPSGQFYKFAMYINVSDNKQKGWREQAIVDFDSPTLSASDIDINIIKAWRFRFSVDVTNTTVTYEWRVPLIVAWKV